MRGQAAMQEWLSHLQAGGDGTIEAGCGWEASRGWKAYLRVDGKALFMGHGMARRMARVYLKMLKRPENAPHAHLKEIFEDLLKIADEVQLKNRRREVPDGALAVMPSGGNA